jgi:hypothetical protein
MVSDFQIRDIPHSEWQKVSGIGKLGYPCSASQNLRRNRSGSYTLSNSPKLRNSPIPHPCWGKGKGMWEGIGTPASPLMAYQ